MCFIPLFAFFFFSFLVLPKLLNLLPRNISNISFYRNGNHFEFSLNFFSSCSHKCMEPFYYKQKMNSVNSYIYLYFWLKSEFILFINREKKLSNYFSFSSIWQRKRKILYLIWTAALTKIFLLYKFNYISLYIKYNCAYYIKNP